MKRLKRRERKKGENIYQVTALLLAAAKLFYRVAVLFSSVVLLCWAAAAGPLKALDMAAAAAAVRHLSKYSLLCSCSCSSSSFYKKNKKK